MCVALVPQLPVGNICAAAQLQAAHFRASKYFPKHRMPLLRLWPGCSEHCLAVVAVASIQHGAQVVHAPHGDAVRALNIN
jgi:hypothetical protein